MVKWTESDRVLIIKTLIPVEENLGRRSSIGKQVRKWEQVASLLPPRLGERQRGDGNDFKCRFVFKNVLNNYRAETRGRHNCSNQYVLTDPIRELLKKRENFMNALKANPAESSEKSGQYFSDQSNDSHTTDVPSRFDNNVEELQRSMERHNATSSLRCASTSLRESNAFEKENNPARPPVRSASRSMSDDAEIYAAEPSARPRYQPRDPIRAPNRDLSSSTRLPSRRYRASSSLDKSATSMAHTRRDEHQRAILDGLQWRLDLEFSRLSSWVQCRSIPLARKDVNKRASCAVHIGKRRKLDVHTATEPLDDLIQECASRRVDLEMCILFQKLKCRIAEDLREITMKLAHDILPGSLFPCSSPNSTSGFRNAEKSMSPEMRESPFGKRTGKRRASSW